MKMSNNRLQIACNFSFTSQTVKRTLNLIDLAWGIALHRNAYNVTMYIYGID